MGFKVFLFFALLAIGTCDIVPDVINNVAPGIVADDVKKDQEPLVPGVEATVPVDVPKDPEFIKLWLDTERPGSGIYKTEKGDFVRLFRVLQTPPGGENMRPRFPPPGFIPRPHGIVPPGGALPPTPGAATPEKRSSAAPMPMMMGRSGLPLKMGGQSPRLLYDGYGPFDPSLSYYTPGYYGGLNSMYNNPMMYGNSMYGYPNNYAYSYSFGSPYY